MILAPGNYIRNAEFQDNTFIIIKWLKRAINITLTAENYLMPIIILLVILISIKIYNKKKIENDIYIFIVGGLASIYSMILSPTFPERSWTGVIVFLLIATLISLYDLDKINKIYKVIVIDLCVILSIIYIGQYISATLDINHLRGTWSNRIETIEKEKEEGNKKITLEPYYTSNSKNPIYGLSDITEDAKVWTNTSIAQYYGLKSIKVKQN